MTRIKILRTFMKQAPIWTLGVGGSPLLVSLGGLLLSSGLFFLSTLIRGGGMGGSPAVKSGLPLRSGGTTTSEGLELDSRAALSLKVRFVWCRRGDACELSRSSTFSTLALVNVASSRAVNSSVSPEKELWRRRSRTENHSLDIK